ncbi:MAG: beta-galactosidase, partial [Kiritimatiellaeota bacterium]|nr:beta-galactosidase [Kiritimatiellota bacterium]
MKNTLTHDRNGFILNGRRVFLLNGTIPYYRLHTADWGHHLDLLKASGYTGVDVYVPWNYHEPEPGAFDFKTVNRDLGAFLDAAHDRGLYAYLRPGPYICNEWDSGGLPQWLQRVPGLRIRENEPRYLECATRYLREICAIAAPRQFTRGGPVILFAVENEYDFYPAQTDRNAYISHLRDTVRACGIEIPLTACVGGGAAVRSATGLARGVIPTPNYYLSGMVEQKVEDMRRHLLAQHFDDGAPMSEVPVFVTEMGRGEDAQLRTLAGGVKGLGPFNMSGGSHVGFWNGLTNWGGVTPIASVVDSSGITGFDGTTRKKFWDTRRVTGFIHA